MTSVPPRFWAEAAPGRRSHPAIATSRDARTRRARIMSPPPPEIAGARRASPARDAGMAGGAGAILWVGGGGGPREPKSGTHGPVAHGRVAPHGTSPRDSSPHQTTAPRAADT